MKVSYDPSVDALAITFKEGFSAETREIAPEVNVDFDEHGTLISLEIIGAAEKFGQETLGEFLVENWAMKSAASQMRKKVAS